MILINLHHKALSLKGLQENSACKYCKKIQLANIARKFSLQVLQENPELWLYLGVNKKMAVFHSLGIPA